MKSGSCTLLYLFFSVHRTQDLLVPEALLFSILKATFLSLFNGIHNMSHSHMFEIAQLSSAQLSIKLSSTQLNSD